MDETATFSRMVTSIIEAQERIIGPVAVEQAREVKGLDIDWDKKKITITGDGQAAISKLVKQYKTLFGQISVEVCKDAASKYLPQIPKADIPDILK